MDRLMAIARIGTHPPPAATDSLEFGPIKATCFAFSNFRGKSPFSFFNRTMPSEAAFRRNIWCSGLLFATSGSSSLRGCLYFPVL